MNNIDYMARTNSTSQIINYYRKNDQMNQLELDLETCTKGMYQAIQHVLCKGVIPNRNVIERTEIDLKDVVDSLREDV